MGSAANDSTGVRGLAIAIFEDARALSEETAAEPSEEDAAEPPPAETMDLFGAPAEPPALTTLSPTPSDPACRLGFSISPNAALEVSLDAPGLREALEDEILPKDVHDLKAVLRALAPHNVTLRGVRDDVMLLSYLVNPTHFLSHLAGHRRAHHQPRPGASADEGQSVRPQASARGRRRHRAVGGGAGHPGRRGRHLHPSHSEGRSVARRRDDAEMIFNTPVTVDPTKTSPLMGVYRTIDLPLVPVLLRMEQAGVRIDPGVLNEMSSRLSVEIDNLAERIYEGSGQPLQHQLPKQLGDVLFNKMDLPKPMKYGKGKVVSTAQDVLEELAEHHP